MNTKDRIIAGLDIGTTKVSIAIGVLKADAKVAANDSSEHSTGLLISSADIDIIGVGTVPSLGMRNGVVVNIDATTDAIKKAREEAELMAGQKISEVWIGIAGSHIKSFDSKGMVAIRHNEVTSSDIQRVMDAAKAVAVPGDREVLHVLPREYTIDDQNGILDPIGMTGVRLEANVHIITGGKTALQNAVKCTEKAGLKVSGLVLEQLASSMVVLSKDEKELGVAVVDIGGGTSDVIVYVQGAVAYTSILPIGGMHVTNDIAMGLRTPQHTAEELKRKYGCALASLVSTEETIEVSGVGGRAERTIMRRLLCDVIEPRVEETLNFINTEVQKSHFSKMLGAGIVLTGGASQMDGLTELSEFIFDMPARLGKPDSFGGLRDVVSTPAHSTVLGLILYGAQMDSRKAHKTTMSTNVLSHFSNKIKQIIDEAF
ncbi:MAG: cell division protein FtsA [Bdellovibrionales bacterium]